MSDLRARFGKLVAAHRRRAGMTQQQLAEAADVSVYMISKIENGTSGTRFAMIEKLSEALQIDPAELFTAELPHGTLMTGSRAELLEMVSGMTQVEAAKARDVLKAAFQ